MEQQTGSQLRKEYVKAIYCHPAYDFFGGNDAEAETPVLLRGESHGWRSLASYSPWGHKESDTTE